MQELLIRIGLGALAGAFRVLPGYFKSAKVTGRWKKQVKREKFDWSKLGFTMLVGAGIGAYSTYTGLPGAEVLDSLVIYLSQEGNMVEALAVIFGVGGVIGQAEDSLKAINRNQTKFNVKKTVNKLMSKLK